MWLHGTVNEFTFGRDPRLARCDQTTWILSSYTTSAAEFHKAESLRWDNNKLQQKYSFPSCISLLPILPLRFVPLSLFVYRPRADYPASSKVHYSRYCVCGSKLGSIYHRKFTRYAHFLIVADTHTHTRINNVPLWFSSKTYLTFIIAISKLFVH